MAPIGPVSVLLVRGAEAVRIACVEQPGQFLLIVEGPRSAGQEYTFADLLICVSFEKRLLARFVSEGYAETTERRVEDRIAPAVERRRAPQWIV